MIERKKFSKEFKIEAVRLMRLDEKPVSQLALELGVRRNQLYKWEKQVADEGATAFSTRGRKLKADESEVVGLRRELAKVKEERDILKKAAAYFARELP
jgi:transposase